MTRDEVLNLQPHDEVRWTDPDDEMCSRVYKILNIEHYGPHLYEDDPVVKITDISGDYLECFASELS